MDQREVCFNHYQPNASRVYLLGDFNGWDRTSLPMERTGSGLWARRVLLKPGAFVYRFRVHPRNNGRALHFGADDRWSASDGGLDVIVVNGRRRPDRRAIWIGRAAESLMAARMAVRPTIPRNELEQNLLCCFRELPDAHVRSDVIEFIRDFVRFRGV